MVYVLQVLNYASPYRGNFIESLEAIEKEDANIRNIYLFCHEATDRSSMWNDEMSANGKIVRYLSIRDCRNFKILRDIIEQYGISVIHLHFFGFRMNLLTNMLRLGKQIEVIRHFHNHSEGGNGLQAKVSRRLFRKTIMVGCSNSVTKSIKHDFPYNQVITVNNAINFERLNMVDQNFKLVFNKNEVKVLMFGFDFYRKGVDLAIEAIRNLREKGIDMQLYVVFSVDFDKNETLIKEHLDCMEIPNWIHFLPPRNDIATYYSFADVFLSPSREEGFVYSIPEALWCKCVIVASDIGGQDFHKNMPYLFWHKAGDVDDLMRTLEQITTVHISDEEMAGVREQLKEKYSVENWGQEITTIYRRLLR